MRHMPQAKTAFHPPKAMHYWWSDQRETLKHTLCFPVWRLAASVCMNASLQARACVCFCEQVGWILSVMSCINYQRANQNADDDGKAAIGSRSLPSSWQQPLWPTTISSVSSMCAICFLLHITTFHMCDAIISSLCWRNARVYNEPCSLHRHIANFFREFAWIILPFLPLQHKQQPDRPVLAS